MEDYEFKIVKGELTATFTFPRLLSVKDRFRNLIKSNLIQMQRGNPTGDELRVLYSGWDNRQM